MSCLTTTVRAQEENLSAEVKQIFRTRCLECHGDTRREADINILDLSTFVGAAGSVVPGNVDESVLYDYIASDDEDFRMPEAPRPPLSAGEIEIVRKWIEAKA
ncbi:MAG: c-type cytochrome domain-containing protein, partial [Gimesia chilikensis]